MYTREKEMLAQCDSFGKKNGLNEREQKIYLRGMQWADENPAGDWNNAKQTKPETPFKWYNNCRRSEAVLVRCANDKVVYYEMAYYTSRGTWETSTRATVTHWMKIPTI